MTVVAATETLPARITENARLALNAAHSAVSSASAVVPVNTPLSKGETL